MPTELQIIRIHEFIRVNPRGHFDLAASKRALGELARACRKRGINQALLDLRALHPGAKPVFSPNDLVALVNTFREIGFMRQERLAVSYGSDPFHRARLFAFLSTVRGWNVQAFSDFEKAVFWLSSGQDAPADAARSAPARQVPVRHLKRGAKPAAHSRMTKDARSRSPSPASRASHPSCRV